MKPAAGYWRIGLVGLALGLLFVALLIAQEPAAQAVESAPAACPGVPSPDLSAVLTLHPTTISALFHNSSATCSYPIGVINYTGANTVFDYVLAAIPPNSTLTLVVNLAACPSRTDAFQFGPGSTSQIILPPQPPSPPYNGGLLVSQTINCATPTSTLTPTATRTSTSTPTATPTCILGDINCDGIVDIRDYGLWRQNFGATNCGNPADLNGDCIVDIRDYGTWRANFGHTAPGAPRVLAAVRPLLGAPPIPGVSAPSLARHPAPAAARAG